MCLQRAGLEDFETSRRREVLSFKHHKTVTARVGLFERYFPNWGKFGANRADLRRDFPGFAWFFGFEPNQRTHLAFVVGAYLQMCLPTDPQ
jgi:hypothetical protein